MLQRVLTLLVGQDKIKSEDKKGVWRNKSKESRIMKKENVEKLKKVSSRNQKKIIQLIMTDTRRNSDIVR